MNFELIAKPTLQARHQPLIRANLVLFLLMRLLRRLRMGLLRARELGTHS